MSKLVVRLCLATSLMAGLTVPALADGSPVPWPKKASRSLTPTRSAVQQIAPKKLADGSPVPWPKKSATSDSLLLADGSPVPWPKK
jgi:hypothetical protein